MLDFGGQVSFLLLLPPSDDVCTAPGQNNPYTPRSGFLTLPLQIFELGEQRQPNHPCIPWPLISCWAVTCTVLFQDTSLFPSSCLPSSRDPSQPLVPACVLGAREVICSAFCPCKGARSPALTKQGRLWGEELEYGGEKVPQGSRIRRRGAQGFPGARTWVGTHTVVGFVVVFPVLGTTGADWVTMDRWVSSPTAR